MAYAIAHYTELGYSVAVPITDANRYDIIIDDGIKLQKVEVKTTTQKNGSVELRTLGGNQSWSGVAKRIKPEDCDLVFLVNLLTNRRVAFTSKELEGRNSIRI